MKLPLWGGVDQLSLLIGKSHLLFPPPSFYTILNIAHPPFPKNLLKFIAGDFCINRLFIFGL
jgi:hypothetical protein